MKELDIPSVKILHEERGEDKKTLKYTFFNTQTGLKDYFYSYQKVNHIPNLLGSLLLTIDDNQQNKFFTYFSHRLHEHWQKEPIKFEEPLEKGTEEIESKSKKNTTKLTPQQITKLRDKSFSWQEIREFCNVSEWTIRRWNKGEPKQSKKKVGRPPKISGKDLIHLESCVGAYKTQTQQWISCVLSIKIGKKISQPTISRLYKKYGITRKTLTVHFSEQKPLLEEIKPFTEMIRLLPQPRISATDECAFYLNETPRRGYNWKGERAIIWKPGNFMARYTLILFVINVETKGVIDYQLIAEGAKAKDFHDFMANINLPTDEKYYLLLDNAKIHHAVGACKKLGLLPIKELLISKNIEPKYLVPYTPQLNPVELCFNFLRSYVEKQQPRDYEELKLIIEQGIAKLQEKDMTKYFRHCMDYDFVKTSKGFE